MPAAMRRAPNENWQAPNSSISASGRAPKATGRKQSRMNIKRAPAAMIQLAVFEDIMIILNTRTEKPLAPNRG